MGANSVGANLPWGETGINLILVYLFSIKKSFELSFCVQIYNLFQLHCLNFCGPG